MRNLLGIGELDTVGIFHRDKWEMVYMEGVRRRVGEDLDNEHQRRSGGVLVAVASVRSTRPVCIDEY